MECTVEKCPAHIMAKDNSETLKDHEERIREIEKKDTVIAKIQKDIEHLISVVDPLAAAVEILKNRPAKRWDVLVTALISGGGMYILSQLVK